jgi:glycosyltransferase involved in cell wall biosynthesis
MVAEDHVVTPSFNQAQFLEATLLSVLRQAYATLKYIVMDGGSTDSSAEIIEYYAKHLAYWRSAPDGGQTSLTPAA